MVQINILTVLTSISISVRVHIPVNAQYIVTQHAAQKRNIYT